jgi:hypothetical protein
MTRILTELENEPVELVDSMSDENAEELVLAAADAERDLQGAGAAFLAQCAGPPALT